MVEKEIIEQCRKGDLQNFRLLVERLTPMAFSLAFRILGDEAEATDIVQESMITLWEKIKSLRSDDSLKPWVSRIVVNKCRDELRRKKRAPFINTDDKAWELLSGRKAVADKDALENEELGKIIVTLTGELSPKQKTVFVLAELEEMSHDEIQETTGMSKTAIKANLWSAKEKMKELLKKYI
ncbi:MAG: RNA polymerase sigma factor [Bacteroidales bacterium]